MFPNPFFGGDTLIYPNLNFGKNPNPKPYKPHCVYKINTRNTKSSSSFKLLFFNTIFQIMFSKPFFADTLIHPNLNFFINPEPLKNPKKS